MLSLYNSSSLGLLLLFSCPCQSHAFHGTIGGGFYYNNPLWHDNNNKPSFIGNARCGGGGGRLDLSHNNNNDNNNDSDNNSSRSSSATSTGGSSNGKDINDNNELAIQDLALKLKTGGFQNIVILVGAGASVSAGIPDFRTKGTGLYDQLAKYNLPYPEAVFDLDYYLKVSAKPFLELCPKIWPGQKNGPRPTLTHVFMKLLQDHNNNNCLRRIYTQNIDGLEALAGVSTDKLVECHGHFRSGSCTKCKAPLVDYEHSFQNVVLQQQEDDNSNSDADEAFSSSPSSSTSSSFLPPRCPLCGGVTKPDIVFFGEELPLRFQQLISTDVAKCDLLIVIGTSLLVNPVASIPSWVNRNCPRVLLNREIVGDFLRRNEINRGRDLIIEGDCDDGVEQICRYIGWEKELRALYLSLQNT